MVVGVLLEISIQEERHEVASYQSAAKITPPGTSITISGTAGGGRMIEGKRG